MNRIVVVLLVLVAGVAGYLLGRAGVGGVREGGRGQASKPRERSAIDLKELERLTKQQQLVDELVKENESLREQVSELTPEVEEPAVGTRLPDGRIVGGAKFSPGFQQLAMGFMDTILSQFIKRANLTTEQERRVREEIRTRSGDIMQALADFTNGDVTGDEAYDKMLGVHHEAMKVVNQLLDEKQRVVFDEFRGMVQGIMHAQVTGNELALLRTELGLDADQEKRVKVVLEERYRRVQERVPYPLPNVFFKVVRREGDADIYKETSAAVAALLNAEQAARYASVEKKAAAAPFAYRNMLIPK